MFQKSETIKWYSAKKNVIPLLFPVCPAPLTHTHKSTFLNPFSSRDYANINKYRVFYRKSSKLLCTLHFN